ncbi:MAG: DUF2272 domain-containing protein [Sphingopyxis sp.]|uniref:DUF2272 domain-containing protein n=1 Tax=Sphingopyxis sp. TaxID=1908224 RepID=UPI002AB8BD93|nr:DUF2272 domain-containing protein [Sphingopyxis sp.]MDZ3833439.1 DUF2272 domain-containing protein [Sphingopyxis sp.]
MSIANTLADVCLREWEFFRRSSINLDGTSTVGLREYDPGGWQRVADYWKFIGGAYANLTGLDRGTPWSAAFISWAMNAAGAGDKFPYSAGHATYINRAIKNAGISSAALIGHRLGEYAPKVGDLVGYWRGGKPISFDNAPKIGWYESHTDIVVEVGNGFVHCIGGNVLHSVTKRAVRTNASGIVTDRKQNWFVVIENRI